MIETGRASLSERNKNIIVQELNVNPEWLETGQGQMFFEQRPEAVFTNRTDRRLPTQSVPLYNIEGTARAGARFSWTGSRCARSTTSTFRTCPAATVRSTWWATACIRCSRAATLVLYKQVSGIENIFWGDMYLLSIDIDGEEYVTVKYIQKSENEGCVKLVSQNPHHADKEVPVERIRALAFVKASIRMNSIR